MTAALPGGGFVVTWMSQGQDGSGYGIYAQRFDGTGAAEGGEFRVNTTTADDQRYPTVTALSIGGFVVTWLTPDAAEWSVAGQTFDAAGLPVGSEFHFGAHTLNSMQSQSVSALKDGSFVATWPSWDGSGWWVNGRRFDGAGAALGEVFPVNSTPVYNQFYPSVAGLADGSFVIAWNADVLDGSVLGVQARHFPWAANHVTGSALDDAMDFSDSTVDLLLSGGGGNDVLVGGTGQDTAIFAAVWADSTVSGDAVMATVSSPDGVDSLSGFENLSFAGVSVAVVLAANDAPVATNDSNSVVEATAALPGEPMAAGNLLANDSDADLALGLGEALAISAVEGNAGNVGVTLAGTCGQVVINSDGSWQYSVDNQDADTEVLSGGEAVTEVFAYTVMDLHGATAAASLSVTVYGSNDDPELAPVSALTYTDTAVDDVFVEQGGALSGTDPEGDTLVYGISSGVDQGNGSTSLVGLYGVLTVNHATGDYHYTPNDAAIEALGTDVSESFTLTVSDNLLSTIQNLTIYLTQSGATETAGNDNLTGSAGNDTVCGLDGDDSIDGGDGIDTLKGGMGNDTYLVDTITDIIVESSGAGTDTISTGLGFTLNTTALACVENLILTGGAASSGTGNALNNVLSGNSGNNVLDGKAGADTLRGAQGNDRYYVDNAGDLVVELSGEGDDYIYARVDYSAGANIERLYLIEGSTGVNASGNSLANVITGNSAANSLSGGLGNDLLVGGVGNDTYLFARGDNADTIKDNDSAVGNSDVLSFLSGVAYDQLWFRQFGSSLLINVIGTNDKVTVQDWYSSANNRVEQIRTEDGNHVLLDSQVQSLVSAMAAMSVPTTTTLTVAQHTALDAVIAASWS